MDKINLIKIEETKLRELCLDILDKISVPDEEAAVIVDSLIDAEKRGVHSHGVGCLARYVGLMQQGIMRKAAQIEPVKKYACMEVWDGQRSNAQVLGKRAMERAMDMAGQQGIGLVAVKSGNHFGAGAYYAQLALQKNMIGIAASTGSPTMAPWGGAERMIGNNPLSVAVPAKEAEPVVLDMAQSVVAFGRITNMQKQGARLIPKGWALDSEGMETQEASRVYSVLPIAQYKGFGIALMIDVISGILFGGATGDRADDRKEGPSQLFIALNPELFGDSESFLKEMDERIMELKHSRRAAGVEEIYMPGEIEARNKKSCGDTVYCLPEVIKELKELQEAVAE